MQKIELLLNNYLFPPRPIESIGLGLQISDRLIDIHEVMSIFSVKRTTLYKGIKNKVFPEPIRFSKRMVRWRLSDVMAVVGQSKPFIPNMPAANDISPIAHFKSTTPELSGAPPSLKLKKLEDRKRELLANATPLKSRAQLPVKRRYSGSQKP